MITIPNMATLLYFGPLGQQSVSSRVVSNGPEYWLQVPGIQSARSLAAAEATGGPIVKGQSRAPGDFSGGSQGRPGYIADMYMCIYIYAQREMDR